MFREHWLPLFAMGLLALAGRCAMIAVRPGELAEDRDAYLGIAESVHSGRGFSSPGSSQPTAYRPPLYPLVLSLAPTAHVGAWVATVNVLSGIGTVWLTYALGIGLGLPGWGAATAAGLVAIDPLLVRYASQPMTESLCTLLVTGWLWRLLQCERRGEASSAWWSGVWFGLAALCRPTVWLAAGMIVAWSLGRNWYRMRRVQSPSPAADSGASEGVSRRSPLQVLLAATLGCAIVVLPWVVRNWLVLGTPILTTTHGGYTLLLGNNPVFYEHVVRQPWGAVWDDADVPGPKEWYAGELWSLSASGVTGEVEIDRGLSRRAVTYIRREPLTFLAACGLRELWFWNVLPLGETASDWPRWLLWSVGSFYILQWLLVAVGLVDVLRRQAWCWIPGLLLVTSFAAVHLVYWSNARMRAPLIPVLALLAVQGGVVAARKWGISRPLVSMTTPDM